MYRNRSEIRNQKFINVWFNWLMLITVILFCFNTALYAQEVKRAQPVWWFGGAIAANLNYYGGTTQMLNSNLTTPAPFHKGFGAGLYLAPLMEYRPNSMWGGMLQVGYDDRRASFNDVVCPCGEIATLSATLSYISIEPSIRFAPFSDAFYIFLGPRIGFNWAPSSEDAKTFFYTQEGTSAVKNRFNEMNGTVISGQIGIGYDIALASQNDRFQVNLSPFLSYQPYFGQDPRSVESWAVSTLRIGTAVKFGSGEIIPQSEKSAKTVTPDVKEPEVKFSIRAPKAVLIKQRVRETFPIRNYVFFNEGSVEIPNRYVLLTRSQATNFKEEQLQEEKPENMTGRSLRQMTVYYNILNILGDRMKRSPGTNISLSGASEQGPEHGKARAETIKKYLVDVFGIDGSRITTDGRNKPLIPSEEPGATKEIAVLKEGDSRVDIVSKSPEMMLQVGGESNLMLKPVQIVAVVEDPLDSHVLFNTEGAKQAFASWSLEVTDEHNKVQTFGPFTGEQENISGNTILGNSPEGDYKVVMLGQTKSGKLVKKESSVHLVHRDEPVKEALRFSILFDFDKSKSITSYEKFLTEIVTPLISDNSVVVIHGHTDNIGEVEYNNNLSRERVQDARSILERAIMKSGKRGITFETFGFGENLQYTLFDNSFPEGRFYNRSVIIDIVPE